MPLVDHEPGATDEVDALKTGKIHIPVTRLGALVRGVIQGSAAVACAALTGLVYGSLTWNRPDLGRLLVDVSIAIIALPMPIVALVTAFGGLRWLALALWPARLGIDADDTALTLRFGPFGTRRYEANQLRAVYPFETDGDPAELGFEAFLPPEQQIETLLPRMTYRSESVPVDRLVLRFAAGSEREIVAALRPAIGLWRGRSQAEANRCDAAQGVD